MQYPKKYKFYWKLFGNFSFLLDMETSRPKNTRISFLHKTFQKTLKIPESEFYTLKIWRAYLSLCHGNTIPEGNIYYIIHMQKLCCLYDEKGVPASRSKVQEDKRKWKIPHSGKRLSFIIRRKSLTLKQIFRKGISEKLLKNGEHKSPPRHTFM